ncbi:cholecystokinin receptor type A-like [Lytechinus variegatus]|uniref:cholecystokinin receptor type A-like n=1 Tax=Lytechinus variegatus TaxID=7654 RepID=UPI001BB13E06|nr:cholecystokinin receptor type A-like [Lytechinus variegatus]XP_041458168.1 cholecystokinin receptor type A-like [Lytechinus variegatus]
MVNDTADLSTGGMATDWDGGSLASTTQKPFDNVPKNQSVNMYLLICIYVIIFLLAVIGNILVIVTLVQNKRMRTVTNIFLLSLSVSDLLFAILCMPFTLVGNILQRFIFGEGICKIIPYFQGASVAVSVWTMCAISLERYHAICNPLASRAWQTKTRACKIIVAVWLMSFLVLLPFAIYTEHEQIGQSEYYKCRERFPSALFHKLYITCIFMALMFIPLFMMCIAYALIIRELWRGMHYEKRNTRREKEENGTPLNDLSSKKNKGRRSSIDDSSATESFLRKSRGTGASSKRGESAHATPRSTSSNTAKKRVVKMLLVLVILFFVCWTPTWSMNIWATYDPKTAYSSVTTLQITLIRLLMYTSACVNPIVYCFMNKKFRQGFIEAFGCCCCFVGKKTDTTSLPSQTSVRRHPITRPHSTNYTNRWPGRSALRLIVHSQQFNKITTPGLVRAV